MREVDKTIDRVLESCAGPVRLSVDPGLGGTGVAIWSEADWDKKVVPVAVVNLYPKKVSGDWLCRAGVLLEEFSRLVGYLEPVEVYCEYPEFFDDAGGHMSAKKGDLQKLTFIVGAVAYVCWNGDTKFTPFEVRQWKGQLTKEAVIRRIRRRIPEIDTLNPKSHSWDAIGIGLHAKGYLRCNQR